MPPRLRRPPASSAEERQWAMFAHLSALLGGLLTSGWGGSFGFFIGPLVIWLMKKDTMPFVNDQGKEALNFAITVSIVCVALLMLTDPVARHRRAVDDSAADGNRHRLAGVRHHGGDQGQRRRRLPLSGLDTAGEVMRAAGFAAASRLCGGCNGIRYRRARRRSLQQGVSRFHARRTGGADCGAAGGEREPCRPPRRDG